MSIFDNIDIDFDPKKGFSLGGGGGFELIPEGTVAKALLEDASYKEPETAWALRDTPNGIVEIQWRILEPAEFKNRIVFQKLHVHGSRSQEKVKGELQWIDMDETIPKMVDNKDKAIKHLTMLMAIDMIANGERTIKNAKDDLDSLKNNIMDIQLSTWKMGDREGNWVSAVTPSGVQEIKIGTAKKQNPVDEGDIPF